MIFKNQSKAFIITANYAKAIIIR